MNGDGLSGQNIFENLLRLKSNFYTPSSELGTLNGQQPNLENGKAGSRQIPQAGPQNRTFKLPAIKDQQSYQNSTSKQASSSQGQDYNNSASGPLTGYNSATATPIQMPKPSPLQANGTSSTTATPYLQSSTAIPAGTLSLR